MKKKHNKNYENNNFTQVFTKKNIIFEEINIQHVQNTFICRVDILVHSHIQIVTFKKNVHDKLLRYAFASAFALQLGKKWQILWFDFVWQTFFSFVYLYELHHSIALYSYIYTYLLLFISLYINMHIYDNC